jgi:hypothetical protein
LILALLGIGAAACDRTPTDPARDPELDASLTAAEQSPVYAAAQTSLSHLFRSAVTKIGHDWGRSVLQRDLVDWRRLNEEARAALTVGDRQTAQARIEAVRAEQIRIVVRVLGRGTVHRVVQDVGVALARVRLELGNAEASGKEVRRAHAMTAQVTELLTRANTALAAGDQAAALDQVTQASDLLDGVAHFLIALQRIPALETLFADAVAKVGRQQSKAAVGTMLATLDALNADARAALRRGERERAQQNLEAARKEQIRILLGLLDTSALPTLIKQVDVGIAATKTRVTWLPDARLNERASRMLGEAASLNARARVALNQRDAATALDLASHAAGLVNALQHLLPR